MSDFCEQCSLYFFNEDTRDVAGISTEKDTAKGMGAQVLCEGCCECNEEGDILCVVVDHNGKCMTHTDEQHKKIWERQNEH